MELWTSIPNILSIALTSPSGETTTRIPIRVNSRTDFEFLYERTKVTIDYRLIVEKGTSELIFFRFDQPSPGIWKIEVEPVRIIDGRYHLWLPVSEFLSGFRMTSLQTLSAVKERLNAKSSRSLSRVCCD